RARGNGSQGQAHKGEPSLDTSVAGRSAPTPTVHEPQEGHTVIPENSKGYSYRRLFSDHLRGARQITILDPYVRAFWQVRNFMELVQLIQELTPEGEETSVKLI